VIHALAWLVVVEFDLFHLFLVINRLQKFVTDRADILHTSLGDQLILKSCYHDLWGVLLQAGVSFAGLKPEDPAIIRYQDVKSTIVHNSCFTF
jgi:hypothetical protein